MIDKDIEMKINDYLSSCKMWELCNNLLEKENNRYKDINLATLKQAICYAVSKTETISDILPKFTVHGLQHSCNVLNIMGKLLESMQIVSFKKRIKCLSEISSYEVALLILSAFFHDIGMCMLNKDDDVTEEQWFYDYALDKKHYDNEVLKKKYLRDCHHLRIKLFINDYTSKNLTFGWYEDNGNLKSFLGLERICKSHNEGKAALERLENIIHHDEKFCAIILRLADILDLDNTRAPLSEMKKIEFKNTPDDTTSWFEWLKHRRAEGISFDSNGVLVLLGKTDNPVIYQKLNMMVVWIRAEFDLSREVLRSTSAPYRDKQLPQMIKNNVESIGFEVGQYTYEIEKNDAINLFMGENLYMDKMVFVRELLQNAIDASICYKKIKEKELLEQGIKISALNVKPVDIHVWKDDMDKVSFVIDDNGIGMDRDIILNYFLKIGKSYYNSNAFKHSGINFMPISRFGVGFLTAFLATDEIVIVTKHYKKPDILLQLVLNKNADEFILRENNSSENKYDINQHIYAIDGTDINLTKHFRKKESGTLIYFKTKDNFVEGDVDQFVSAINKYLLVAPISVRCNINGSIINPETELNHFMDKISVTLDKNEVYRALHKKLKPFSADEEIIFESLPISISYTDENGKITGKLQLMTTYDTTSKTRAYNFSYSVNYDDNSISVNMGSYQKNIAINELNSDYQKLGIVNKVNIYFNGINHLSHNADIQEKTINSSFVSGFLLLEGKYRPEVDVARSGQGYLNLETLACLNYTFWKEIQNYVKNDTIKRNAFFSLRQPNCFLNLDNCAYGEFEILEKAIQNHNWNEISFIKTEKGFLSVDEISTMLLNEEGSELEIIEDVFLNQSLDFRSLIIRYLLSSNFDVILRINDDDKVLIKKKTNTATNDSLLPPLFFIKYENVEVLKYGNYPLNENHWFSKWLTQIYKSEEFEAHKGFLVRSLQKDILKNYLKRDELISNVNRILKKYTDKNLEEKDVITYKNKEKDLRDWLQIIE